MSTLIQIKRTTTGSLPTANNGSLNLGELAYVYDTSSTSAGAGGNGNRSYGSGGSGREGAVIFKYPDTFTIGNLTGLTTTTNSSGGYKITQFTAGSGNITFS